MTTQKNLEFTEAFRGRLNALKPGWSISDQRIIGPEGAAVYFSEEHNGDFMGHVDVKFCFQDDNPSGLQLWDCVSGFGASLEDCASSAAALWAATSASALLELKYSRRGEFADHFHGRDPQGLTGWHCICGAVMGYGQGESGSLLQEWWLSRHSVLPAIASALVDLPGDRPHAIKIFFGGSDIAEVRVDGEIHEAASDILLSLDWPRLELLGFLRGFIITLHRE